MTAGVQLTLRLALATGQRLGEICGAQIGEIDLDTAEWRKRGCHALLLQWSSLAATLARNASVKQFIN